MEPTRTSRFHTIANNTSLETRHAKRYVASTKFIVRLMLAVAFTAFVASSVAYAAGSAEMAAAMINSDDAVMEMSDCDPCGDADAGELAIACDFVCGAGGFAAVLAPQVQGIIQAPRETLIQ